MNSVLNYIDFSIKIENDNLCLGENTVLYIEIKNKSEYKLENGLFRCIIDDKIFTTDDETFYNCINDFDNIGDLEPGYKFAVKIPIKVIKVPISKLSEIVTYLNFHIVRDGELIDINYNSEPLKVNLLNLEILDATNFTINSLKNIYSVEEDIDLSITLKNTTSEILKNIKISQYIPDGTSLVINSIDSTSIENLLISEKNILVSELKQHETIKIFYKVSINENTDLTLIKSEAKLNYRNNNKDIALTSNNLEISINSGEIFSQDTFVYYLDKETVCLDEIVTHNIILKNKLDIDIYDMKLKNDFFDQLKFIKNSLIINGIHRVGESIEEDIILGELEFKDEFHISFKTSINKISPELNLFFTLEYKTNKRGLLKQNSNINRLKILYISFENNGIIKTQSKESCNINEIIDFSIKLFNSGNNTAKNVYLYDKIPQSLEIIPGTIYLNNKNLDDTKMVLIEEIEPYKEIIITYKARAVNICTNENHYCKIEYFEENSTYASKLKSNDNSISVIGARIGNNNFRKDLSSYSSKIGEIITALITIENTGNITCESLNIYENKNPSIEIIEQSLQINGSSVDGNITTGINIEKIHPNEIISIKYQLKIINIPRPNPIKDRSILEYTFLHDGRLQTDKIYSTKSNLYINNPNLSIRDKNSMQTDNINKKYIHKGDLLFYNIELENLGNVAFENVVMSFNFPKDLLIDINSLRINNYEYNISSLSYIKLPNINVSQKIYVEFYAKCVNNDIESIKSGIYIDFIYKDLKNKNVINVSKKYIQEINIINPDLEITKFLLDKEIQQYKELVKNINLKNTGNILLKNLKLHLNENEYFKNCDSVIFINDNYEPKSDIIDIEKLDINESVNIAIRYSIEDLPTNDKYINESEVYADYSYTNEDNSLYIKRKSNKLKINIKDYRMTIDGRCIQKSVVLNEIATYMLTISNSGNTKSKSTNLRLQLEEGINIIENSITVNGVHKNNSSSIELGSMNYNDSVTIKFDFKVSSMPYNSKFSINAELECEYIENQQNIRKSFLYDGNKISVNDITLDIAKSVSSEYLQSKDRLTIQTILNNTGSVNLSNIELIDNQNRNLVYVDNSTYIDGERHESLDPLNGIVIPSLNKGENVLITYEYEYKPRTYSNKMTHYSEISYSYNLSKDDYKRVKVKSDNIYIEGALSTFKQFNIENEYELKENEPDIYEIVNVFTDCDIDEFYEIKSPKNNSYERNINANKKVVVKGITIERVEYLSKKDMSSLYMLERIHPFTVFLNIPQDEDYIDLNFQSKCENVFYKTTGSRSIFISSLISIEGLI